MNPDTGQPQAQSGTFDAVHAGHGMAGMILFALAFIFFFHYIGFRFVVGAGVGSR